MTGRMKRRRVSAVHATRCCGIFRTTENGEYVMEMGNGPVQETREIPIVEMEEAQRVLAQFLQWKRINDALIVHGDFGNRDNPVFVVKPSLRTVQ